MPLKKIFAFVLIGYFSLAVAGDCTNKCREEYEECLKTSHSVAKEKICASLLRECEMSCTTNGE